MVIAVLFFAFGVATGMFACWASSYLFSPSRGDHAGNDMWTVAAITARLERERARERQCEQRIRTHPPTGRPRSLLHPGTRAA